MKLDRKLFIPAVVAAGLFTGGFTTLSSLQAQDGPPPPPDHQGPPPRPNRDNRGPGRDDRGPGKDDRGPGPLRGGPRGERPPPPPRPEDDQPPARPVDETTAPAAVKLATDAATSLAPGAVWVQTGPRGDQHLHATLLYQGKTVAVLEFNPADGTLMPRGVRPPPPPAPLAPPAPPMREDADGKPLPPPPAPPVGGPDAAHPPAPDAANAPVSPVGAAMNPEQIKARLPDVIKGLSAGQGAEVMPREGFWKVPIISQNRVVGEIHVSGDGKTVVEEFRAARDAAIFAR